jgi:hypothetical protein
MTPLHTDDDQLRRLDEMVRAMHLGLIAAHEGRHDKAVRAYHLQRVQTQARRVITELNSEIPPESERQNRVFDLGSE